MSTINDPAVTQTITIPPEHLELFRSAVAREIEFVVGMVTTSEKALVEEMTRTGEDRDDFRRGDVEGAYRTLRRATALLDQIDDGPTKSDTEVFGRPGDLLAALDAMGRHILGRLSELYEYAPAKVEETPWLIEALSWSAEQAGELAEA